jgi:hypothetical protein
MEPLENNYPEWGNRARVDSLAGTIFLVAGGALCFFRGYGVRK